MNNSDKVYRSDDSQNFQDSSNKYNSGTYNSRNTGSLGPSASLSKKITRSEAHDYERKLQDLIEKNEILENRFKTSSDQKLKILQRLKDCEEENERMRDQIARQAAHNKGLNEEVSLLQSRNNDLISGNKNTNEKCKTKFEILNRELEERDNQLEKLISQLKAKDETIKYYSVNNEQTIRSQNLYKEELEGLAEINKQAEEKIRLLESNIDELYINRKSEASLLLEIEHLKDDNVRLLQLLKSTEEFKDFAYLAENVSGGIKFIKSGDNKFKRSKSGSLNNSVSTFTRKNDFTKECERKKIEGEDPFNGDNWVPADAFKCAYDFKNKYHIEMSEPLINDLLTALNRIWRDREKKQISRIKTKYQGEVMNLRRKANMQTGYDEFTAGKTICKLKKDLKNVREDLRTHIVEKNKYKSTPAGIDLVDNALKVASSFQKTKKNLEGEIHFLKKKLEDKEDKNFKENFERLKFNEGSFWMIGRVLVELDTLTQRLDELYSEYEDRIKNVFDNRFGSLDVVDFNSRVLSNSNKWFNQSMKETLEDVRSKFEKWHFDIQKTFDVLKYSY